MSFPSCNLCGKLNYKRLYTTVDYISKESYLIGKCTHCSLVRTLNSPRYLDRYYGESYYGEDGIRFFAVIEKIIKFYRYTRANEIMQIKNTPGSVLDIGCGRGIMLSILANEGWTAFGTEIDSALLDQLKSANPAVHAINPREDKIKDLVTGSIDVITMFHVLEHLTDPLSELKETYQIQNKNDLIIIEVPNYNSFQSIITRRKWFHLDAPRHTHHFSQKTLVQLLNKAGYKTRSIKTHSVEYNYYGIAQSFLNLVTFEMNVLYSLLKRKGSKKIRLIDKAITIVFIIPVVALSVPLELFASLFGCGGVLHVVAEKT